MATTTSITTTYAGEFAGDYIAAALLSGVTLSGGGVTIKPNIKFKEVIKKLINARYERNDVELIPGNFRVKGDTIDIIPAYSQDIIRISLFGDEIERILVLDNVSLEVKKQVETFKIFPAKPLSSRYCAATATSLNTQ